MAFWQEFFRKWLVASSIICTAIVLSIMGCGKTPVADAPKTVVDAGSAPPETQDNMSVQATAVSNAAVNYKQSFEDAVITEVLEGQELPPAMTIGGKNTALLRAAIEETWPSVKLIDAAGNPIAYTLHLETSLGAVDIKLNPRIAPNHVRNILALAKAGYYDGLCFERNVHQESEIDGQKSRLDLLIAGCPIGTGAEGFGHLGYFLRSESQADLKHSQGTVGFWHEEDPDSAGCRFYITLGPAPVLDGKFTIIGNVSNGLDVLKKIAAQPTQNADPSSADNERPVQPAIITRVTITPDLMEK